MKIKTIKKGKYQLDKWQENESFFVKFYNNNKKEYNRLIKYYRFRNEQQADDYIKETLNNIKARAEEKEKRKQERLSFKNPAKVGDILVESWGYDQTNIDYYQVVKVSKKSVQIRAINSQYLESDHFTQDRVKPAKNSFKDKKPLTKMVRGGWSNDKNDYYVKMSSYSTASLWDNAPNYQTSIGFGH